jgi:hypothetical protein
LRSARQVVDYKLCDMESQVPALTTGPDAGGCCSVRRCHP